MAEKDKPKNVSRSETQHRRKRVWELTLGGYNYREVASKIREEYRNSAFRDVDDLPKNFDHQYVSQDIYRELEKIRDDINDMAMKHLTIQVQRIEKMVQGLWKRAQKIDGKPSEIDAIKTIRQLQRRKAKLLGLDDPERIEMLTKETEGQEFEWPDPEDAPQLVSSKSQTNGEIKKNGTSTDESGGRDQEQD